MDALLAETREIQEPVDRKNQSRPLKRKLPPESLEILHLAKAPTIQHPSAVTPGPRYITEVRSEPAHFGPLPGPGNPFRPLGGSDLPKNEISTLKPFGPLQNFWGPPCWFRRHSSCRHIPCTSIHINQWVILLIFCNGKPASSGEICTVRYSMAAAVHRAVTPAYSLLQLLPPFFLFLLSLPCLWPFAKMKTTHCSASALSPSVSISSRQLCDLSATDFVAKLGKAL